MILEKYYIIKMLNTDMQVRGVMSKLIVFWKRVIDNRRPYYFCEFRLVIYQSCSDCYMYIYHLGAQ